MCRANKSEVRIVHIFRIGGIEVGKPTQKPRNLIKLNSKAGQIEGNFVSPGRKIQKGLLNYRAKGERPRAVMLSMVMVMVANS
jgi:hypothetical protein